VTGESIAQVASQTLSNLQVINQVVQLPVLRPLAGDDKAEIVAKAQQLGTFDISTEPYEDCCSLFIPQHPVTRAKAKVVQDVESKLNVDELVREAIQQSEKFSFVYPRNESTSGEQILSP